MASGSGRETRGKRKSRGGGSDAALKEAKKKDRKGEKRRHAGPCLPNSLRKELDLLDGGARRRDSDEEIGSEEEDDADVYEYEEGVPEEEETNRNRRFDEVQNLEYELPEEFEDEDVPSEDEDVVGDDGEDERGDKHRRMLEGITGIPAGAFTGTKKKEPLTMNAFDMGGSKMPINIHDLLDPLHGKSGYEKLRKSVQQIEKKPMTLHPPLPKVEREKLERKVAYEHSKKDITRWEPLVKRNREAPTIYFKNDTDLGFSTVGSIASTFEPRTEFEKKMATLMSDPNIVEAHREDGKRLLELNEISVEDVKARQNQLAKMRGLLFRHDMKQKRIKKIKSKTYHRMLKKGNSKTAASDMLMDPEALKEEARKREFKRAEERLTLKHKNKSKWAQRILKRGLNAQDEGTRAAIAEQLHQHEQLTRKMNSMRDSSSEDSSSEDEDDEDLSEDPAKILLKARDKTLEVLKEEENIAQSGVLSLPFMVRGLRKKKEAAEEEAQHALDDYDVSLGKLDDADGQGREPTSRALGGRRVFGVPKVPSEEPAKQNKSERYDDSSDSEAEIDVRKKEIASRENVELQQEQWDDHGSLLKRLAEVQETASKDLDIGRTDLGSKPTYEVSVFASGSWRKMPSEKPANEISKGNAATRDSPLPTQNTQESNLDGDVESEDEMVEGILSSHDEEEYVLPSQSDLIRRAFAGDDVELEFEKDKEGALNEEVPEPEKPILLPGWGQWTDIQRKKGLPSWMVKEHEDAKHKREEALKNRKDAHLKHVIISEKHDKKAEKLHTKSLPFPFTSKEVFEQNLRMPIGPDFNPATSVRALIRPAVVKEAGMKIEPIKFEEAEPYQKSDEPTDRGNSKSKWHKREKGKGAAAKKTSK